MTFLLDVNVLIALIDPTHLGHDQAHHWFRREGGTSWATCPITENGVVRIVGHPRYPNTPGSPSVVVGVLQHLRRRAGHVFWPCDISLLDWPRIASGNLLSPGQVTDTYLLALAIAHRGRLATLDRRLSASAVRGGAEALHVI